MSAARKAFIQRQLKPGAKKFSAGTDLLLIVSREVSAKFCFPSLVPNFLPRISFISMECPRS